MGKERSLFSFIRRKARAGILLLLMAGVLATLQPKKAEACSAWCQMVVIPSEIIQWFTGGLEATVTKINLNLLAELTAQKLWIVGILWEDDILPALMMMTDQLTTVAMQQVQAIGMFLDAKQQLETQQLLQKMAARAHKDYHPSTGMCEFGSVSKSLAASERKTEFNSVLMSRRMLSRALGAANTASAGGLDADRESRIRQFKEKFCDKADNNNGLTYMCTGSGSTNNSSSGSGSGNSNAATIAKRKNKDIDFARTVGGPWTLDIDFTDTKLTDNEEEVMALASNLYANDIFTRSSNLAPDGIHSITDAQKSYMDMRALVAKESVAQNSFNAITAMKSAGTLGSRDYLRAVLTELGVPESGTPVPEVDALLGFSQGSSGSGSGSTNNPVLGPSYYAQMEVLTKKIYQNPDFYTNLYDKPANVERKGVALQAIGLMQKFDLFKSYLRNEATLSVLLELAVSDLQDEIENESGVKFGTGQRAGQ